MGMISLFRTPRPKQFSYNPVFYDARKESLKEREQKIKQELGIADESTPRVSNIKGQMRGYYKRSVRGNSKSNLRLILIFIALCLVAYFLLYH
jgi:hypothetical protein